MAATEERIEGDSVSLGVFGARTGMSGLTNAEVIALSLSALWLLGVTVFLFVAGVRAPEAPPDPVRGLTIVFAIFMPVAMIWIACIAASSTRAVRNETQRLQEALDAMRQAYVAQQQASGTSSVRPSFERKLDEIALAQKRTGEALALFTSTRQQDAPAPGPAAPRTEEQPRLALENEVVSEPVAIEDFITALHFPEDSEDNAGFEAMERAMKDRQTADLVTASRDILTLLGQDGIYMDDLWPDRARPEIWRRFASGERGRTIAALGGVRDRSAVALATARMKTDHVFRDSAHHFLRKFDKTFAAFESEATDGEIIALSDTRTARAFMLLGRVAGTFD